VLQSLPLTNFFGKFMDIKKHVRPSLALDAKGDYIYIVDLFNHPQTRTSECPSGNAHANARALAKVANCMVLREPGHKHDNSSDENNVQLLSQDTIALAVSNPTSNVDNILRAKTTFTKGGWAIFNGGVGYNRQGSVGMRELCSRCLCLFSFDCCCMVGWFGMGGSAFGYTCSLFGPNLYNKNSSDVQNAVIDCAREVKKKL
jgi:hypothetical protein